MLKLIKSCVITLSAIAISSCASGYKNINPANVNYVSKNIDNNILFEYKHDLLEKKYRKNENKNKVKLIAVKITNNTAREIVFGHDVKLTFENGNEVIPIERDILFKRLKQSPASYLFYLLLAPVQIYETSSDSRGNYEQKAIFPIGLVAGTGLAGGNMIAASSANKKLKTELLQNDIMGRVILPGETIHGLVGLYSETYDAIKLKVKQP